LPQQVSMDVASTHGLTAVIPELVTMADRNST